MVTLIGSTNALGVGSISEQEWAQIGSVGNEAQVVRSGAVASPGGVREVVSTAAWVKCCNGLAKFTTSQTVIVAANGSAQNRIDLVVVEFNWQDVATARGTPANSAEFKVVQGTAGGGDPTLTQDGGTVWQVPIARVIVRPSVGVIAAADIADIRPTRRQAILYRGTIDSAATQGPNGSSPVLISEKDIPDPGWPYRLEIAAQVKFQGVSSGYGEISATIDGNLPSNDSARSRADTGNAGMAHLLYWSVTQNGACVVRLRMLQSGLSPGDTLSPNALYSAFNILVIPA